MCIIFSGWMKLLEKEGTRSIGCAARRTPEAKSLVNIIKNIKKFGYNTSQVMKGIKNRIVVIEDERRYYII